MDAESLRISKILTNKFNDIDCNEEESAILKQYLKANNLDWDKPSSFCYMILVQFPNEYSEAYDESLLTHKH